MATIATSPNAGATGGFASSAPSSAPPPPSYAPAPTPSYAPSPSAAAPARRSPVIPIVIVVVLLLAVIGIGGGVFLWSRSGSTESVNTNNGNANTNTNENTNDTGGGDAPAPVEAMRYWLELDGKVQPARVAAVVPLASGQSFRFHFTPTEDGYLYVVGPGENNVPTAFLTSKPFPGSGVKNNSVSANENYSFPRGEGNWITLDDNPGTELYTIVFSKTPLDSLGFLNQAAGEPLTEEEQSEWNDFLSQHKANAPATAVMDENGNEPYVSVKQRPAKNEDEPLVFDVRVEHK